MKRKERKKEEREEKSRKMLRNLLTLICGDTPNFQSKRRSKQIITVPFSDAGSLCK